MCKSIIISYDSYSWVKYCAGIIAKNSSMYEVIIFSDDSDIPIHNCNFLCKQSVSEQRRFDVFNIGKSLGIKKISNFKFSEGDVIQKFIVHLQFLLMVSGINTIYFQNNNILYDILIALRKQLNLKLFMYGSDKNHEAFILSNNIIRSKCNALKLITGYNTTKDKVINPIDTEYFYKID